MIGRGHNKDKLGRKIQMLRRSKDITQEELAERVNLSRTHMGHIEQGRKTPSLQVLQRIAKTLKVDLKRLILEGYDML